MDILEVNSLTLFEKLASMELKIWRDSSEIKSPDILRGKKAYIFSEEGKDIGYLIYSTRCKNKVYIEDLVVIDPKYFVSIMLTLVKLFAPYTIVAFVEPTFQWFFNERTNRHFRKRNYILKIKRTFRLFGENLTYVRLSYEDTSGGR